ncbi:MAG: hypothetical protein ACKPDI_06345 [Actinomycetota bacterium]
MTTTTPTRRTRPRTFGVQHDRLVIGDVSIRFQRTLRVSENGINALPPGFGSFPLRVVDPRQHRLTPDMVERGGVMLPLYQREAMWIDLDSHEPVAVQIGAGGRCVVSGTKLKDKLRRKRQNYVVLPDQPWLDGFKTGDGEVRQFVAVPAGSGMSAEAQLTGADTVGGLQIQVWHLTAKALRKWRREQRERSPRFDGLVCYSMMSAPSMALGLGGRIRQEIYPDTFSADDWRTEPTARVWVHLVGAAEWRECTGEVPPPTPVSTESYVSAGLPWFDLYDADRGDLPTAEELRNLRSVGDLMGVDDDTPVVSPYGSGVVRYGNDRRDPLDVPPGTWPWV